MQCCVSIYIVYPVFSLLDVDECSSDTYPCDSNANCTNNIGSFSCNCMTGYTGSGITCEGKLGDKHVSLSLCI